MNEPRMISTLAHNILFDQENGNPMRRVLVINTGSLLEQGLETLLASKDGLEVLNVDFESEEILITCFDSIHPNVVLINREASLNLVRLLDLLCNIPSLSHLQIAVVSADSNIVDVYENQEVYELRSEDFFDFLNGVITHINTNVDTA